MRFGPTGDVGKVALAAGTVLALATVLFIILLAGGGSTVTTIAAASCEGGGGPGGGGGAADPPGHGYGSNEPSPEALSDIPGDYLEAYRAAGEEYGIDWTYIAAIGKIETDHGRYNPGGGDCIEGPSTPYGTAKGPMQFIDSTWASVGVDGDGDGVKDPCNFRDAIPATANYLTQSGAPDDMYAAIYAYNHADWYVQDVMDQADKYRAAEQEQQGTPGGDEQASALTGPAASMALASIAEAPLSALPTTSWSGAAEWALSPFAFAETRSALASPQGWDAVMGDEQLTYADYTAYDSALSHAAGSWDDLRSVPVEKTGDGADLSVGDSYLEAGVGGRTYSDGRMYFNPNAFDVSTQNAQNALATHEFGHALGLGHESGDTVMQGVTTNSSSNHETPSDRDEEVYYAIWGDPPAEGTPTGNGNEAGGEGGGVEGNTKAVFPLPKDYFDSFDDTWSAPRPDGRTHEGTDLMAPEDVPIYSITDGTVVAVSGANSNGWNELGGYTTMIEAAYSIGPIQKGDTLYYAHQNVPTSVSIGDSVKAGQQIGVVGDTGYGGEATHGQMPFHLHQGWYDPSGARAEASSGAMNPYPMLQWLIDNGGTVSGGDPAAGDEPESCENPTDGQEPPAGGPDSGGGGEPLEGGSAEDLLNHPNFDGSPGSISDLQGGQIDSKLIATLMRIVEKHSIYVTAMISDHPYGKELPPELGGGPNSHAYGLTADIAQVDGKDVASAQTDPDVIDVGKIILSIPPADRPTEVIGPTAWTAELGVTREDGFITDSAFTEAHYDHLHVGYSP